MSRQHYYYGASHLHYITTSTCRRVRVFDSERFKLGLTSIFDELGTELGFKINDYVPMPEHCHLLIWPSKRANPSQIMQAFEQRIAKLILKNLRQNLKYPWCRKMRFRLLPSVRHHAHNRVAAQVR